MIAYSLLVVPSGEGGFKTPPDEASPHLPSPEGRVKYNVPYVWGRVTTRSTSEGEKPKIADSVGDTC